MNILITGASGGIGSALSEIIAKSGHVVAMHGFNSYDKVVEHAQKLVKQGYKAQAFYCDLRDNIATESMLKDVWNQHGKLDLLINNAGIFFDDNPYSSEQNYDIYKINFLAPLYISTKYTQLLKANNCKGHVIMMLDYAIKNYPEKGFTNYIISKAALWQATQKLAIDAADVARFNALAPSVVVCGSKQNITRFNANHANNLLKIGVKIDDIFKAIEYLHNAKSITGQLLFLDGGKFLSKLPYYI